jgi:hypothetical protein
MEGLAAAVIRKYSIHQKAGGFVLRLSFFLNLIAREFPAACLQKEGI